MEDFDNDSKRSFSSFTNESKRTGAILDSFLYLDTVPLLDSFGALNVDSVQFPKSKSSKPLSHVKEFFLEFGTGIAVRAALMVSFLKWTILCAPMAFGY
jgi:hypothetical protein